MSDDTGAGDGDDDEPEITESREVSAEYYTALAGFRCMRCRNDATTVYELPQPGMPAELRAPSTTMTPTFVPMCGDCSVEQVEAAYQMIPHRFVEHIEVKGGHLDFRKSDAEKLDAHPNIEYTPPDDGEWAAAEAGAEGDTGADTEAGSRGDTDG